MRIYQDPSVDGYSSPTAGQISGDVSYTFTITIDQNAVCPLQVGPYSVSTDNPMTYEYNLYTNDPQAELTEIYYCTTVDSSGTGTSIRGWRATFSNADSGASEVFTYASITESASANPLICDTLPVSTMVSKYNL
jgi:hypothetical protein